VRDKFVPTMDYYMTNGYISFTLGPITIVLVALYFVGFKSIHISPSKIYHQFELMSNCGSLLHDI